MRTIDPTTAAAIGSPSSTPTVTVTIDDPFDRPEAGQAVAAGAAGQSALIQLANGNYVRAYVSQPGTGANATVATQLVTDRTNAGQWGTYGTRSTTAAGQAGVALALMGGTMFLFYQRRSDNHLCYQTSADGSTWNAETVLYATAIRCWGLASAGNNDLFAALDHTAGVDTSQDVLYFSWNNTSWSSPTTWTNQPHRITGTGASFHGSTWRLALGCQNRTNGSQALCRVAWDGANWSAVIPIHPLDDPAAGLSHTYPSACWSHNQHRIASTRYDSGADTGSAGQRTELWTSPDGAHWHLEQIIDAQNFTDGASIANTTAGWAIADGSNFLPSQATAGTTPPPIDASNDLCHLTIDERLNAITSAELTLQNTEASYTPTDTPTSCRIGGRIQIGLGLNGSTTHTHTLYISAIRPSGQPGRARITAEARAGQLKATPPVDRTQTSQPLGQLLTEIAIHAGLPAPNLPGTAQFSQTIDSFATGSFASWETALRRLCTLFGADWFTDETDAITFLEPQPTDPVTATYGDDGLAILGYDIQTVSRPNSARATGLAPAGQAAPFAEATDGADIRSTGQLRHTHSPDRMLTTSAQCAIRAELDLRRAQRSATEGTVQLPFDPSLQVGDVISVETEGLGVANLRISGLHCRLESSHGLASLTATVETP